MPALSPRFTIWLAFATPIILTLTSCRPAATPAVPTAMTRPTLGPSSTAATASVPLATGLTGRVAFNMLDRNIWAMDADGSQRVQVTHAGGNDFDPHWSPDGKQIVFRTSRGHYAPDREGTGTEGIFIANADGSGERQLWPPNAQTVGGLFPDWSSKGKIAFSSIDTGEHIFVINPDGTGLVDLGAPPGANAEGALWSPDGAKILFGSHPGNGEWQIWRMNADGSDKRQLTHAPAGRKGGQGGNFAHAWSPDGRRIAFSSDRDGDFEVYVMDADGSHETRLTRMPGHQNPEAWLSDGRIVFSDWSAGRDLPDWYIMRADGTNIVSLPQLQGANAPIDWWP